MNPVLQGWSDRSMHGIVGRLFLRSRMRHREQLKRLLLEKSFTKGSVTLASGKVSDYYFDCKLTTLDPKGAVLTGKAIFELLEEQGIQADAIGGLTMGADPIVAAVVAASHHKKKPLPGFLIRKERKTHGLLKQIEGFGGKQGSKVVIVDEVCTTGESTLEAIGIAKDRGFEVVAVISLVDREEGGSSRLGKDYKYFPVFTASELLRKSAGSEESVGEAQDAPKRATSFH